MSKKSLTPNQLAGKIFKDFARKNGEGRPRFMDEETSWSGIRISIYDVRKSIKKLFQA